MAAVMGPDQSDHGEGLKGRGTVYQSKHVLSFVDIPVAVRSLFLRSWWFPNSWKHGVIL